MNMSRARGPRYRIFDVYSYKKEETVRGRRREQQKMSGERKDLPVRNDLEVGFPPTVTETMREMWKEMRAGGFTIQEDYCIHRRQRYACHS
jgi:hypothetical protein